MSTGTNKERLEQNNLKLEDIKTQIQNLPEAGGTVEGVKQFSTIEEMQADTTAKEGDLAIVYRSEVQNATVDSRFQVATFPETVVLDTAVTDPIDLALAYKAVDSSVTFDCSGSLDSSSFRMDCYIDNGSIRMKRIQYTSSDGITYTRTDTTGNPVDFGTKIYYENSGRWNDTIGKFIQISGSTFEGLFRYSDGSWVLAPTQLTATPDYVCEKEFYGVNGAKTGTMPNNGTLTYTPSEQEQAIPAGYTSGGTVKAIDYSNTVTPDEYGTCDAIATNILGYSKPYIELEYIQSSGTQYINTKTVPNNTTKIELSLEDTDTKIDYERILGVGEDLEVFRDSNTNNFKLRIGSSESSAFAILTNTKYKLVIDNTGIVLNDTTTIPLIKTINSTKELYVFYSNGGDRYGSFKLYYMKIYNSNELIRDFVPAKNLDGMIGLYDKLSGEFFYNAGTGNFIAGGVV